MRERGVMIYIIYIIYIYIYIYIYIMVIVVGNAHGDTSSNPGRE